MIRKFAASVCLGVAFIVAGAATVWGDVSGNFDLDIILSPDGVQTEAVKFDIDLRSNLEVNVTLSGLTLGVDAGFGNTGPEFSIANLSAALGPLTLFNQLVFAAPFFNKTQAVSVTGTDLGPTVNSLAVNGLTFVKARFGLNFDVAGFTISNLAILEDVDFPNPLTYIQSAYFTEGFDNIVDVGGTGNVNQTPTLGFGNLITLQGQTRNRVTVTGATGLCVRPELNLIKGRSWPQSVDPGCGELVFFSYETLSVSGLVLLGFDVELDVTWTPENPVEAKLQLDTRLFDLVDLTVRLESDNITQFSLARVTLKVATDQLNLRFMDAGGDFVPDQILITANVILNPNQNPASLVVFGIVNQNEGLVFLESALGVSRGPVSFNASGVFGAVGGGVVVWQSARMGLSVSLETLTLGISLQFQDAVMRETAMSFGVSF